jgi:hypothetical protein
MSCPSKYASLQWSSVSLFRIAMAHADLPLSLVQILSSDQVDFLPASAQSIRLFSFDTRLGCHGLLPRIVPPRKSLSLQTNGPHEGQGNQVQGGFQPWSGTRLLCDGTFRIASYWI